MIEWTTFNYYQQRNAVLTTEECKGLIEYTKTKEAQVSILGAENDPTRNSDLFWLDKIRDTDFGWLFDKLKTVIDQYNLDYNFEIEDGFHFIQIAKYKPGQMYHTHMDLGMGDASRRKITLVVQLSHPSDSDGGVSFGFDANNYVKPVLNQGDGVLFPCFLQHRAESVTVGERYSLVVWALGKSHLR